MKKKILFLMNNLSCGGAEKSLISLLETIDYSQYDVDLFLFKHEGLFFNKIPKQVNLLEEPSEYKYFDMSVKKAVIDCIKKGRFDVALFRVLAGYIFKIEKHKPIIGQRVWKYLSRSLKKIDQEYDVAIGYLEGYPINFCIDNVLANKKIGFIHNDYDKLEMDPEMDIKYFDKLDHIVTVSQECANVLMNRFPSYKKKIHIIYNIVSPTLINKLSLEKAETKHKGITIASVGRLHHQKGFEMAVEASEILVRNGYDIRWFVVGEGEERNKLEQLIIEKKLQYVFKLIGVKENPYPYIKEADIYVQPSRYEGKSIAIDEAKILRKPIIVTNFRTAKDQIENEQNGLIVDMNAVSISEGIRKLIHDEELSNKFIHRLSKEKLGTESEVQKLYQLFNIV